MERPVQSCPQPWEWPSPDQPGTFEQQFEILDLYLADPTRKYDPDGAWRLARELVLPHARREHR